MISGLSVLHRSAAATLHIFLDEAKHNITFDPRTPAVIKEFLQLWNFKLLILKIHKSKKYVIFQIFAVISGLSVLHRSAAAMLHIFLDEAKPNHHI